MLSATKAGGSPCDTGLTAPFAGFDDVCGFVGPELRAAKSVATGADTRATAASGTGASGVASECAVAGSGCPICGRAAGTATADEVCCHHQNAPPSSSNTRTNTAAKTPLPVRAEASTAAGVFPTLAVPRRKFASAGLASARGCGVCRWSRSLSILLITLTRHSPLHHAARPNAAPTGRASAATRVAVALNRACRRQPNVHAPQSRLVRLRHRPASGFCGPAR